MNYLDVCRQAAHACPEAKVTADALQSVIAGTTPSSSLPYTLLLGDGLHHFKLSISRIALPLRDCVVVSHEDVAAVIRLEEERRTHAAELMASAGTRSAGRSRASCTIPRRSISPRSRSCRRSWSTGGTAEEIDPLFEELRGVVAQAQSEIRTLSYLLHPPLLAEVGLEGSLRRYIDGFSRRTGVEIAFHWGLAPGDELGDEVEFAILRVAQEALANVHRHSGAKSAAIHIEAAASEVRLTIATPVSASGRRRRTASAYPACARAWPSWAVRSA